MNVANCTSQPMTLQNQAYIYPVVQKSSTNIILFISAFQNNFELEGIDCISLSAKCFSLQLDQTAVCVGGR